MNISVSIPRQLDQEEGPRGWGRESDLEWLPESETQAHLGNRVVTISGSSCPPFFLILAGYWMKSSVSFQALADALSLLGVSFSLPFLPQFTLLWPPCLHLMSP